MAGWARKSIHIFQLILLSLYQQNTEKVLKFFGVFSTIHNKKYFRFANNDSPCNSCCFEKTINIKAHSLPNVWLSQNGLNEAQIIFCKGVTQLTLIYQCYLQGTTCHNRLVDNTFISIYNTHSFVCFVMPLFSQQMTI